MSLGKLAMSRILHEEARVRTAILGAGSLLEGAGPSARRGRQLPDPERLLHLDRRRHRPDPAQHHRRARAGPAEGAGGRSRRAVPPGAGQLAAMVENARPLAGIAVAEIGGEVATRYCARLFALMGADVWRAGGAGSVSPIYGAWLDQAKQVVASPDGGSGRAGCVGHRRASW